MTKQDGIESYAKKCEALEKAATKGPWEADGAHHREVGSFSSKSTLAVYARPSPHHILEIIESTNGEEVIHQGSSDQKFIANARTAEPFWRKLAMRYREALITLDSDSCLSDDCPHSNVKQCLEHLVNFVHQITTPALALTRKDLEGE